MGGMDGIVRIFLVQCYGSRSALNLVGWIRIQIQEGKNDKNNWKSEEN
jgi:hypothetical protein